MSPELRLHGKINETIEYFATAAGCHSAHQHFYELSENGLRLFAPGSELHLSSDAIQQRGVGGCFCEYMFGVDQPIADLVKPGVHNRLVVLGASYNSKGRLELTGNTEYNQSYTQVFHQGHAIDNFFFFIDGLKETATLNCRQQIVKHIGKTIKSLEGLNHHDDSLLAEKIKDKLPENCAVFLIRLSHTKARHFQKEYQNIYYRSKQITPHQQILLDELAENLQLDHYQKQRISIDAMYHHRENYRIIDEYKNVLIDCYQQGQINRQNYARLTRLKTLALRDEIPLELLTCLDTKLHPQINQITQEPVYTAVTRDILQDLSQHKELTKKDMVQLLYAKQKARRHHDNVFEQLLLETGKLFDEAIRDGAPLALLEEFSRIITFFDRYDTTSTNVSRIAFMEHFQSSGAWLDNLLQNRAEFNKLEKGLFSRLFFDPLMASPYLTLFGKRKLKRLQKGLEEVAAGVSNTQHLNAEINQIEHQEEVYKLLYSGVRDRIRNRYFRFDSKEDIAAIYADIDEDLTQRGLIKQRVDMSLFRNVIYDIKKEVFYLRNLFPDIIKNNDQKLRQDFLTNSGLDIFHIEELENEYVIQNGLDQKCLQQLRSGQ